MNNFSDISLAQWMALTPSEVVETCLNVGPELLDALNKENYAFVNYPDFSFPPADNTPQKYADSRALSTESIMPTAWAI